MSGGLQVDKVQLNALGEAPAAPVAGMCLYSRGSQLYGIAAGGSEQPVGGGSTMAMSRVATLAEAKLKTGAADDLLYVNAKEAFYKYCVSCTITADDDLVLTTGDGGATRWELIQKVSRTQGDTGWLDRDNAVITAVDATTARLTLSAAATLVSRSVRFQVPAGDYDITFTGAYGLRYCYMDVTTHTLVAQNTVWDFNTQVPVMVVYWSGTSIVGAPQTELHGVRDTIWHYWAHFGFGLQYEWGLTFTGAVQADSNVNPANDQCTFLWSTSGQVADEDYRSTPGTGQWAQVLGSALTTAAAGVFNYRYYNGTQVTGLAAMADRAPFIHGGGTTTPQWESAGVLTPSVTGDYIVYHYFVCPQVGGWSVFARPHNAKFASLSLAQGARPSSLIWDSLAEVKHLYSAVWRVSTSNYTTASHRAKLVSLQDFRLVPGSPTAGIAATNHQSLSNRDAADAHPASSIDIVPTAVIVATTVQGMVDALGSAAVADTEDFAAAAHNHDASALTTGTLDGDRLPAISTGKRAGVPAAPTPSGMFLRDDDTWQLPASGGLVITLPTTPNVSTTMATSSSITFTGSTFDILKPVEASGTSNTNVVVQTTALAAKTPKVSVISTVPKYNRQLSTTWSTDLTGVTKRMYKHTDGYFYAALGADLSSYSAIVAKLDATTGLQQAFAPVFANNVYAYGLWADASYLYICGGNFAQTDGRLNGVTGSVAANTITKTAHGLSIGDPIVFSSGATVTVKNVYWVRTTPTPDTFTISSTPSLSAQQSITGTGCAFSSVKNSRGLAKLDWATLTLQTTPDLIAAGMSGALLSSVQDIQSDGSNLYVCGNAGVLSPSATTVVIKLSADASAIISYTEGTSVSSVYSLQPIAEGLLIAGSFTIGTQSHVAILNTSTMLPTAFTGGIATYSPQALKIGTDIYWTSAPGGQLRLYKRAADNSGSTTYITFSVASSNNYCSMVYHAATNQLFVLVQDSAHVLYGLWRIDVASFTADPGSDALTINSFWTQLSGTGTVFLFEDTIFVGGNIVPKYGNATAPSTGRILAYSVYAPPIPCSGAYVFNVSAAVVPADSVGSTVSFGAATSVTVTESGLSELPKTQISAPVTPALPSTPSVGDPVYLKIERDALNLADTESGWAWIYGIKVDWT